MDEVRNFDAGKRRNVLGFEHVAPAVWRGKEHMIYAVPGGFQLWRETPIAKPLGTYPTLHRAADAATPAQPQEPRE